MEKFAIMSDIQGNYISFMYMLNDAISRGIKEFIFLGDHVTDSYSGDKIIKELQKLQRTNSIKTHIIKGNREEYINNYSSISDSDYNERKNRKSLGYETLSESTLEYIEALPQLLEIEIDGTKILLYHGDKINLDNVEGLYDELIGLYPECKVFLLGHTHIASEGIYKNCQFLNPGSIGQPLDTPTYKYLIGEIDKKTGYVTSELVELPVMNIMAEVEEENKVTGFADENPEWEDLLLMTITDNIDYVALVMKKVNQKQVKDLNSEEYNKVFEATCREVLENRIRGNR